MEKGSPIAYDVIVKDVGSRDAGDPKFEVEVGTYPYRFTSVRFVNDTELNDTIQLRNKVCLRSG